MFQYKHGKVQVIKIVVEEVKDDCDTGMTPYVDRINGTYTEFMRFHDKDIDLSKIKEIGVYNNENFKLLYDQEVRINFK